jgi:Ser/Thr protein kinase RdoA (MazF antagonist)
MGLVLFQPDRFSESEPVFSPVSEEIHDEIVGCINTEVSGITGRCNSVTSVGTFSLNSRNFRFSTEQGDYLLKLVPSEKVSAASVEIARLQVELKEAGFPVQPPIMDTGEDIFLISNAQAPWLRVPHHGCVFPFIDGHYFKGQPGAIVPLGQLLGKLFNRLKLLSVAQTGISRRSYGTSEDQRVFGKINDSPATMSVWFEKDIHELLENDWNDIRETWARQLDQKSLLIEDGVQFVHMDLHPHNLLFSGIEPKCILDFDSIALAPLGTSVGFAAYKLLRQAMVRANMTDCDQAQGLVQSFREAFVAEYPEAGAIFDNLANYAKAEIMRRLIIVFRLNLDQGNSDWNSVVPMHLAAFREIDVLFGQSGKQAQS